MNTNELIALGVIFDKEDIIIVDDFDWYISTEGEVVATVLYRNQETLKREPAQIKLALLILDVHREDVCVRYCNGVKFDLRKRNLTHRPKDKTETLKPDRIDRVRIKQKLRARKSLNFEEEYL